MALESHSTQRVLLHRIMVAASFPLHRSITQRVRVLHCTTTQWVRLLHCTIVAPHHDPSGSLADGGRGRAGATRLWRWWHHEPFFNFFKLRITQRVNNTFPHQPASCARISATMDKPIAQSIGADVSLPDWLTAGDPAPIKPSREAKALVFQQFETVFPRVIDLIASGYTLTSAVKEVPYGIDLGAFTRWVKKDPTRNEMYKEAKEIRTEAWAGKVIEHATAEDSFEDVARSKLIVDAYKWLMAADNRKTYGQSTQIELGGQISILGALAAANERTLELVEDVTPRLEN